MINYNNFLIESIDKSYYWLISGTPKDYEEHMECYILKKTEKEINEYINEINNKNYSYIISDVINLGYDDITKHNWVLKIINKDDNTIENINYYGNLEELQNHIYEINNKNYSYTIINVKIN
jgi:hypothetical protein